MHWCKSLGITFVSCSALSCPAAGLELPSLHPPTLHRHVLPLTALVPQLRKHVPVTPCNGTHSILNVQLQEKRYRSMQEHIRRAHPEHYISKLPATEESFLLMINTPPSERRPLDQTSAPNAQGLSHSHSSLPPPIDHLQGFHERHNYHRDEPSNPGTPRLLDDFSNGGPVSGPMLGTAGAAAALAELHGVKSERDMDLDGVSEMPLKNSNHRHPGLMIRRIITQTWMFDVGHGHPSNCRLSIFPIMILLATLIHLPNLIDSATFSLPFWQTHHLEDPQRSHLFSVLWGLIGLASSLLQSEEESLTTKRRTLEVLQLTGYAEFKMKNDIDQVMIGRLCQQNHRQTSGSGGKILSMQLIKPLLLLVILTKTVLLYVHLLMIFTFALLN